MCANMMIHSGLHHMIANPEEVCHQRHSLVQVEHLYDEFHCGLCLLSDRFHNYRQIATHFIISQTCSGIPQHGITVVMS